MHIKSMFSCAALIMAGPFTAAHAQTVSLSDVKSAQTAEAFLALGGHQVSASEFQEVVVGRPMDEGTWTWNINANGTHSSESKDGTWNDSGGTWRLQGNQYCRESPDNPENCSYVYLIGNYMRLGDESGQLAGWTVAIE